MKGIHELAWAFVCAGGMGVRFGCARGLRDGWMGKFAKFDMFLEMLIMFLGRFFCYEGGVRLRAFIERGKKTYSLRPYMKENFLHHI
jgi:hypothetical protein